MAWRSFALAVLCVLAACRIGFDALGGDAAGTDAGGSTDVDGALPAVPLWAAMFGEGPEETIAARVLEDTAGDLWLAGSTFQLGSRYVEGWIGKLDGETGAFELGGIRRFVGNGETMIQDAVFGFGGVIVVGWDYSDGNTQPTLGALALDGTWLDSFRMGGGLATPGEFDGFNGVVPTSDGGMFLVGSTRLGEGACANCLGTDALVVKMRADTSVEWARAVGEVLGDEVYVRAVALPDGGVIAFGGGGRYDFGGPGASDEAPALISRIGDDGTVHWSLRLSADGGTRGGELYDAVYDPATGGVIVVGRSDYGNDANIAHVALDGTVTAMQRVRVAGERGGVSAVVLADDGGLFIAGYEYLSSQQSARTGYIARTNPSRDSLVWAHGFAFGASNDPGVHLVRSRRGDLLAWANGTGPDAAQVTVWRVGENGELPACMPTIPVTLTFGTNGDGTLPANVVVTDIVAAVAEPVSALAFALSEPVPAAHCGP